MQHFQLSDHTIPGGAMAARNKTKRSRHSNGGLSRRNVHQNHRDHQPSSPASRSDDYHHRRSPRRSTSFDDSPKSIGDMANDLSRSSRIYSLEEFSPLPFEGVDVNSSTSSSSRSHDRQANSKSFSDCISICSDQAVILSPTTNDANDDNSPPSLEISQEEHQEDDSFDPDNMLAPPTVLASLVSEPRHLFHRLSQPVSLPEYILGQDGHPIDMRIESTYASAQFAAASILREFDAAFIKRSNGRWCYAILAEKILERDVQHSKLRFVVDDYGSTKSVSFHKWGECVRLAREPAEANAISRSLGKAVTLG